jgi:hypothetical protein
VTQSKVPGPNLGAVTVAGTVVEKQDQTALVQTTWTSATALNTTTATYAVTGYGTANVGVTVPTTCTAGAVTVEVSQDGGTTWAATTASRQDNGSLENPILLPYFPGVNGTRIYALSTDAFTHVRVKLTTVIVGAGNTVISITAVGGGIEPMVSMRPRRLATYRAVFRSATRPYALGNAFAAAGRKQYATIFHATTATRTVRLIDVLVELQTISATAIMVAELVRLTAATTPATGNPAITPGRMDTSSAAAEATTLALPTTAGTESDVLGSNYWIITGPTVAVAASSANSTQWVSLMNPVGVPAREDAELTMRPGVAEGFAVTIDVDRATNPAFQVMMVFTEEAA